MCILGASDAPVPVASEKLATRLRSAASPSTRRHRRRWATGRKTGRRPVREVRNWSNMEQLSLPVWAASTGPSSACSTLCSALARSALLPSAGSLSESLSKSVISLQECQFISGPPSADKSPGAFTSPALALLCSASTCVQLQSSSNRCFKQTLCWQRPQTT